MTRDIDLIRFTTVQDERTLRTNRDAIRNPDRCRQVPRAYRILRPLLHHRHPNQQAPPVSVNRAPFGDTPRLCESEDFMDRRVE